MQPNVVDLTKNLINIQSVSRWSNVVVSDYLEDCFRKWDFAIERLEYTDPNGERKVSLIARKGEGKDGLALITHSDTVPGQEMDWPAFEAEVKDNRVIGRGACDMKGPLAAAIVAAVNVNAAALNRPVYVVVCADEEVGGLGALQVAAESDIFKAGYAKYGVITEPTSMVPVYAHKGGVQVQVTAIGEAAHTSTERGISANFLITPFLNEMTELAKTLKTDESFRNNEFTPPTLGFNMVLDDGGTRPNVTAPKTVCTLSFRPMPNDRSADVLTMIAAAANRYGFEVSQRVIQPYYISPEAEVVQAACKATGVADPQAVPYGTDAFFLKDDLDLVVLGPGNIIQAHTVGEWIEIAQLEQAVDVYGQMIKHFCL